MHAGIRLPASTQHDTPLLTVFYWQPTPTYVSWEVDECDGHLKRRDLIILRHFDKHFLSFLFCVVFLYNLVWGCGTLPGENPPAL